MKNSGNQTVLSNYWVPIVFFANKEVKVVGYQQSSKYSLLCSITFTFGKYVLNYKMSPVFPVAL